MAHEPCPCCGKIELTRLAAPVAPDHPTTATGPCGPRRGRPNATRARASCPLPAAPRTPPSASRRHRSGSRAERSASSSTQLRFATGRPRFKPYDYRKAPWTYPGTNHCPVPTSRAPHRHSFAVARGRPHRRGDFVGRAMGRAVPTGTNLPPLVLSRSDNSRDRLEDRAWEQPTPTHRHIPAPSGRLDPPID